MAARCALMFIPHYSICDRINPSFLNASVYLLQDNINVDEAAQFLVENILANDKGLPYEESNGDRIKLDQETVAAESKPGCC